MPRAKRPGFAKGAGMYGATSGGVGGAVSSLAALHGELLAQRAGLDAQIAAVAGALRAIGAPGVVPRVMAYGALGGGATRGGGWRPGSLKAHIGQVLRGGSIMAVKDITSAVMKSGYKTKNQTLSKSVGIALTEMQGVAKVGRGQFKLV